MRTPNSMTAETPLTENDRLRALCRQLVRDQDRADDLFRDTVVTTVRDERRRAALHPWLAWVVRHVSAAAIRSEQRRQQREAAIANPGATAPTAAIVDFVELQQHLMRALGELPEAQRDALLLRYFDDLPPPEIAARLRLPVDTAKTHLRCGLATLRERLDAEFGERRSWVSAMLPAVVPAETAGIPVIAAVGVMFTTFALFAVIAMVAALLLGAAAV